MNSHLIRMARYYGVPPTGTWTRTRLLSEGVWRNDWIILLEINQWINPLMNTGIKALLVSGGGGLAGRPLRRVYMRTIF